LAEKRQQILDETRTQFFGKLGIEGQEGEKFMDVVQNSLQNIAKKTLPFPVEIGLPLILALALFLLLHSFAFIFVWVGEGFAWVWFHLLLLIKVVKIEKGSHEIEMVRF